MAKKQKQSTNEAVEVIVPDDETIEQTSDKKTKKATKEAKVEKIDPKAKDKNAKKAKKKERKSFKKKVAEVWSELKKVSKPSFGKVVKNTCVVITVVAICTVLLFGVDRLFSLIYDLLIPNS